MSIAIEAKRGDCDKIPRVIKVTDNDGGETTYLRSETTVPRPAHFAELKYDEFHRDLIELGTKNGDVLLQQAEKGLPSKCVLSYAPLAVGFVELTYEFFVCEKQLATVWRLLVDDPATTLLWMAANDRIAIGWGEIGDLRQFGKADAIANAIRDRNASHPDYAGKPAANVQHGMHSLHDFCHLMRPGDLVIVSSESRRRGVWEVVGGYEYAAPEASPLNYQHQRPARATELDPDELWQRAGGRLADGQVNYRTLGRCADAVT